MYFYVWRILKSHQQSQINFYPQQTTLVIHDNNHLIFFSKSFIFCFVLIPQTPSGSKMKVTIPAHQRWLNRTKTVAETETADGQNLLLSILIR
jgi:hypothetical protein